MKTRVSSPEIASPWVTAAHEPINTTRRRVCVLLEHPVARVNPRAAIGVPLMAPSDDVRVTVPDQVDMRSALWPVEDIGDICAAAASAAATALEYHCNRIGQPPTNLSTLFIHYNARQASGDEGRNVGTSMEAAMKAIATHGACRDETWPFDAAKLTVKPPAHAFEEARRFTAVEARNPADVIQAVSMRFPVPLVGRFSTRAIDEARRTGVLAAPTADELQREGGTFNHAMVVVGYDKTAKTFLLRNCWGKAWGDQGHCRVSFDALGVIAPYGTKRLWFVTRATAPGREQSVAHQAAAPVAPPAAPPVAPPAAPAPPERLSDMAARLRAEIRGDVTRDINDASKRIRDMMQRPAGQVGVRATCPACAGNKTCGTCGGGGCSSCSYGGKCATCSGQGTV